MSSLFSSPLPRALPHLVLALLLALASLPLLHAQSVAIPALDWDSLSAPYRLANESYSASPAQVNASRWLFLMYVNATPLTLAQADLASDGVWRPRVLTNASELEPALRAYYRAAGHLQMARNELDKAQAELDAYNASRTRERDCLEALGLSRYPCSSYESCLKSCFASVQFCQPLAQANGQKFIYSIWDYENQSQALDAALAHSHSVYLAACSQLSTSSIRIYNSSLPAVWAASSGVLAQNLSGSVCQKPFYDSGTDARIQTHLTTALVWLAPLEDSSAQAAQYAHLLAARQASVQTESSPIASIEKSLSDLLGGSESGLPVLPLCLGGLFGLVLVGLLWRAKSGRRK